MTERSSAISCLFKMLGCLKISCLLRMDGVTLSRKISLWVCWQGVLSQYKNKSSSTKLQSFFCVKLFSIWPKESKMKHYWNQSKKLKFLSLISRWNRCMQANFWIKNLMNKLKENGRKSLLERKLESKMNLKNKEERRKMKAVVRM